LEHAGTYLQRTRGGGIRLSRQKLRQAEAIEIVRLKREQGAQTLAFSSRPFVLCGLPVRRLPLTSSCTSGATAVSCFRSPVIPEFGVPFGQDRLVPIFLATLAVQQKSQVVRFRTAAEMLESFGMQTGGKEYRRLVAAFERVFGATIFFGTDTETVRSKVIQRSRFNFMSEAQIWYSRAADHPSAVARIRECRSAQ
jgi:hypothetical protein